MTALVRAESARIQVSEFLGFLKFRPKEERWQLVEGTAIMMNPPTLAHQMIALNLRDVLVKALDRKRLDLVVMVESGARVPRVTDFLTRPDVIVIPGVADYQVYAERFVLVAEVLSPSNTKSLIAKKLRRYKQHPDNLYCLVIDSRHIWVEIHSRAQAWEPIKLINPADMIELPEFGLCCPVGDLYRRTPLDPQQLEGKTRPRQR